MIAPVPTAHAHPASAWIDTHAHLDAPEFAADGFALREKARAAGVAHVVIPAVAHGHWADVQALAHRTGDSYALGIHPLWTPQAKDTDVQALHQMLPRLCADPSFVGLGEIGLDFLVPGLDAQRQIWLFEQQVRLAQEFNLPVIVHTRRSCEQVLHILRRSRVRCGIIHAFNGSAQQAQALVDLGFKLGFGGAVTFERAHKLRHLVTTLPLSALVLETDAPDMPPQWLYTPAEQRLAGSPQGRNTSAELPRIAAEIANLRGITADTLAVANSVNARAALRGLPAWTQTIAQPIPASI